MTGEGQFINVSRFSAATLAPSTPSISVSTFRADTIAREERSESGNLVLRNFRIFREGTFEDSMGFENTWESIHLDQMVAHFSLLRDGNILPNVPVREDHRFSVASVIGYILDIYRDPSDPTFLDCSFEFTEPSAAEKWQRGTYRGRSLEVGMYRTNSGAVFFPVVMGFAFVDIPAVEGLYSQNVRNRQIYVMQDNEETPVSTGQGTPSGTPSSISTQPTPEPQPTPAPQPQPAPQPTPAPAPAPQPAPVQEPTAPTQGGQNFGYAAYTFTINGQPTSDFAAVQRHITSLETAANEQARVNREEFITQLAENNIILASQVDGLQNHVRSLTPEQFESFRASYATAAPQPQFGRQGLQNGTNSVPAVGNPAGGDGPTEVETLEEIVKQHKRAGMSQDKIEKTSSWRKLQELKKTS